MTEAEIAEGWRQVRIQQVLHIMNMHGLTLDDIFSSEYIADMVGITGTQTPHQPLGNTVAGQYGDGTHPTAELVRADEASEWKCPLCGMPAAKMFNRLPQVEIVPKEPEPVPPSIADVSAKTLAIVRFVENAGRVIHYQVTVDPDKVSPSGQYMRFGTHKDDELAGWMPLAGLVLVEVLSTEWSEA